MDSFGELRLSPSVKKGIDAAGYRRPFPIQERAIGPLLEGRSLIGQAKAGSGKTLAFGIPLVESVDPNSNKVQALVLAPTRELAVQISLELQKIAAYTSLRVVTIYGGQSIGVQLDALRRGAHVVVGTPGRIIDHLKRGSLRLSGTKFVVLDEADAMLDMGFIDDVDYILAATPSMRQLSLFSATMPPSIVSLSQRYMRDPARVMVDSDEPSAETLEQFYARAERGEKLDLLLKILAESGGGSAVVFCRTRHGAIKLARELERRYINVTALHGDLSQNQRDHSMGLFRSGRADVLVATDVASRGIDVRQVGLVVNFDVPEDPTVYFHRVGRTARAGDVGKSYTFVSAEENPDFVRILAFAKSPIKPLRGEDAREPVGRQRPRTGTRQWRGRRPSHRPPGGRRPWRRYR
jgi:ATP-dependent RNA helicase DeaD